MRTPSHIVKFRTLALTGFLSTPCAIGYAVEPLSGPEIGQSWWTASHGSDASKQDTAYERYANFDVPIPTAVLSAMPFATFRYIDLNAPQSPRYQADQRIGLGLLHHAAEGDPAWRLDVIRGGTWTSTPSFWARAIVNLAKPYAWLKPRPSDTVFSWLGINTVHKNGARALMIPEFAWTREGADGIAVDLVAPKHFLIGIRGSRFGLMAGAEQSLISYSTTTGEEQSGDWLIQRTARVTLLANLSDEFLASISALKSMSTGSDRAATGAEVSLRWNPNP